MPNTNLHAVVLILLYLIPPATGSDGGTGGGAIDGCAGGACRMPMPGTYLSPWSERYSSGVSGLSLDRMVLGLFSLTAGIVPCGPIFSVWIWAIDLFGSFGPRV